MKGKFGWIVGTIETIVGFTCFMVAQMEISSNSRYTWSRPYTSYEAQVLMTKWVGIALLISGIVWLGLKVYQTRYINSHVQEMDQVVRKGGTIRCSNCGINLTADIERCPRCRTAVKEVPNISTNRSHTICFCSKCGNSINTNDAFCTKCGQKIAY